MCGINLIISKYNKLNNLRLIKDMNEALSHRGFRSTVNSYFRDNVYLGHVRLPIQGVELKFDHPMKIGRCIGAFVGEIFNYQQLNAQAKSDLPVLISEFQKDSFPLGIDGFWAAVFIWRDLVHIVTDDLAKKPLYIRNEPGEPFAVSSEIAPLKLLGPCTMDDLYFSAVAKWGYCIEDRTPYNEIKKIPPTTSIVIHPYEKTMRSYSFPPITPIKRNLRIELEIAVRNRLVSDVPISLLLSGGLDSTIIFELIKSFTKDFVVFHVDNDEAEYLNHLDFKGIEVKELKITEIEDFTKEALICNETPVDLGSVKPQLALSQAIKEQGLNVAISGDGADELFGGYGRTKYYDSQWSDIFHELVYYHLPRLDKLMMTNTIELRSPYLARRVIETALTIPYKDRINKKFLKETFKDIVPEPILKREKHALKIKEIRESELEYRWRLIDLFKEINFGQNNRKHEQKEV